MLKIVPDLNDDYFPICKTKWFPYGIQVDLHVICKRFKHFHWSGENFHRFNSLFSDVDIRVPYHILELSFRYFNIIAS